jgi:hypothetical protein
MRKNERKQPRLAVSDFIRPTIMHPKESRNNIIKTLASGGVLRIAASGFDGRLSIRTAPASLYDNL